MIKCLSISRDELKEVIEPIALDKIGELDGLERGDCFDFVYPVTYVMPDGSLIPVEYAEAAEGEFARWYSENPDVDDPPVLRFTDDIEFEDGTLQTISNYAELRIVYATCD